jgi:conjugal transfer/type IV secretion protein DotA/TraY
MKKIIKNMVPLLFMLLMALFTADAFALTPPPPPPSAPGPAASSPPQNPLGSQDFQDALDPAKMSDYSKEHYRTIFGCPGGFFAGGDVCDTTAYGMIVGQFNLIAMVMGIAVLLYVVLGGAINTAASGEVLGRNWSSTWLPIRTTMAFGLILPTAAIQPYSPAQMATLYAVVIGDNLATTAVKNLAAKVASREINMGSRPAIVQSRASVALAGSVFCAANEWNALTQNGVGDNAATAILYSVRSRTSNPFTLFSTTLDVPGVSMPGTYLITGANVTEVVFGSTGRCGSIELPIASFFDGFNAISGSQTQSENAMSYVAAIAVIQSSLNKYAALEATLRDAGVTSTAIEIMAKKGAPMADTHATALATFQTAVDAEMTSFPARLNTAITGAFAVQTVAQATGRVVVHYTDINKMLHKMSNYAAAPNGASDKINSMIVNDKWDVCFDNSDDCKKTYNSGLIEELEDGFVFSSTMGAMAPIKKKSQSENGLSGKIAPEKFLDRFAIAAKSTILMAVSEYGAPATGNTGTAASLQRVNGNLFLVNPMVLLNNIGNAVISLAMEMFATLIIMGGISQAASDSLVTNTFGAGAALGIFQVLMSVVAPTLWFVIIAGASFSLISLIPIIIGIWGYISIIMMAIQGVAAAPFAVVLLANPEGQGATNQTFQRFLLHWTHLMLAPMIFVLGGVASLALIIVGANIVLNTFLFDMNFYGSDSWVIIIASIFVTIWVLYRLVHKTAMFQLSLQDEVMQILGGSFHKSLGGDLAGEVMGLGSQAGKATQGAMTAAQGIGKGAGQVISGTAGAAKKGAAALKK